MLNAIKVNLNALEYMLFFWQSVKDKEKVGEYYLTELAALDEMAILYDDEFNQESVRKALSAITNRELLNTKVLQERQFWNNNMWVMEDAGMLSAMLTPIKSLSLDAMKASLNEKADIPFREVEVVFVPGLKEVCTEKDNRLYINFFKVMADLAGGTNVTIEGKSPTDFICERILTMNSVKAK